MLLLMASTGWSTPLWPVGNARVALEADRRLGAPVSPELRDRPLEEVLRSLNGRLKVRLTATREMADEKATLLLAEHPAGDLLTTLAKHFDGLWRPTREGYRLERTPSETRRTVAAPQVSLDDPRNRCGSST
jgi:hypothetical protein